MNTSSRQNVHYPPSAFDGLASRYDEEFEYNPITQHLRKVLWQRMLHYFQPGQTILDLNCGTGTDALFLAQNGINVTCIDSSAEMIRRTRMKTELKGLQKQITAHIMAIEDIESLLPQTYDGAISNFGGLNCVANLQRAFEAISQLIKPNGIFIVCMLNKVSLWEITSFLLRGKSKDAFRRLSNHSIDAPIGHGTVKVIYYSPRQVAKLASNKFKVQSIRGLNILSPNPNSTQFISTYPSLTRNLLTLDELVCYIFPFHSLGDHFVIELQRTKAEK